MSGKISYNFLGNSGIKVSNICLGTMTFGERQNGPVQCTEEESHKILDKFVELGGNFIDTADIYQNGLSEEIIGKWLKKQNRSKLVIATKVRFGWDAKDPNASGLSRKRIQKAVNDSLRRLQTDYIDLYQMHCWDDGVPIEETLSAFNDLVREGKVRYLGVSNVTGWQLQKIVCLTEKNNWAPIISLQQQWSLLCRETENEVVQVCRNEGIGFLPWSPLKGGWLTGKIKRDAALPEDSRLAWSSAKEGRKNQSHPDYEQFAKNDQVWTLLAKMEEIGKSHGKSVAQVALRWLLQQDVVPSVIIGAKTLKQLEDNVGASAGWELSKEQMALLNDLSAVPVPYPYEMINRCNLSRQKHK